MIAKQSPPLPRRDRKYNYRILTKSPSLEEVLEDICRCFRQDIEMIKGESQFTPLVIARRIYCYVAHVLTNETCHKISALINRDHTTYLDRVDQCIAWFEISETSFMGEWNTYLFRSTVWKEYFLLKKQAVEEGNSQYMDQFRKESAYWKRQIRQAKANKRRWRHVLKEAIQDNDIHKVNVATINVEKYINRLRDTKKCLLSLNPNSKKAA